MTSRIASLLTPRRIDTLTERARDVVMAIRIAVICRRRGIDPLPSLIRRLGGVAEARRVDHLVDVVGAAWPEAFALSPPCCRLLSHDEALLGLLVEAAESGERRWFDEGSRDLLDAEARDGLWRAMQLVAVSQPGR